MYKATSTCLAEYAQTVPQVCSVTVLIEQHTMHVLNEKKANQEESELVCSLRPRLFLENAHRR